MICIFFLTQCAAFIIGDFVSRKKEPDSFGLAGDETQMILKNAADGNEAGRLQRQSICGNFPRVEAVVF
ncbi:hypothetical protein U14_02439 [Candidatus Moduliflexus flocculans]|uniref:Uncharacterized protein n=1 Tax=Candidatus Moduliflexus flocculans TaxID=1499966 RepID=A0A081BLD0_9BACT|nr:hypothetical protein U14_02439 [Candidatus Moduliflexus flocculans]